ncbi:MAG: hypothetical protein IK055_01565 [Lachnospiraceae bacterium]|nr:hypothetical protein [Lachnospiraceae bacterium]
MRKFTLIAGIVLCALGALSLCLSWLSDFMAGGTKDASNEFYHKMAVRITAFLWSGIGLLAAGVILLVIHFLIKK